MPRRTFSVRCAQTGADLREHSPLTAPFRFWRRDDSPLDGDGVKRAGVEAKSALIARVGTIGEVRAYAFLGRKAFSADTWFAGFGRGRTFTTSGPMLELRVDDVGALALLHALADRGEAKILGVLISSKNEWAGPCVDAINTWHGRPDVPIGRQRG